MDNYLKYFENKEINTEEVATAVQCSEIFGVNGKSVNFKIFHNNVRSLHKNLDEIKIFLEQQEYPFECIVLTETHKLLALEEYRMNGYDIIYNEGEVNSFDGTVVYLKSSIPYKKHLIKFHNISVLKLEIIFNNSSILLLATYRSPSLPSEEFVLDLQEYMLSNHKVHDYELLIGDLNIDILQNPPSNMVVDYLNVLYTFGFESIINKYTRIQGNSATCIDHIFLKSNLDKSLCLPLVIRTDVTDHFSIAVQIVFQNKVNIQQHSREICYTNFKQLKLNMNKMQWQDLYNAENIEVATNIFIQKLNHEISACTFKKKIPRRKVRRTKWITAAIVNSVNRKNELYLQIKNDPHNRELKERYEKYRKELKQIIIARKREFYKNILEKNRNNKLKIWKAVNELKGKPASENVTQISDENDEVITDDTDIANNFNKMFVEMGPKLSEEIQQCGDYTPREKRLSNSLYLTYTDIPEVINIINSLKNDTSPGIDGLRTETLKEIKEYIAEPLVFIINNIIATSIVPKAFKESTVKPIYKNGNRLHVRNYRPISLISNLAKIFEKIIKNRLSSYLKRYKIISKNQYGFQEKISTEDAIVSLTKKIYASLDNQLPSIALFLDLAKAFDTVNFKILFKTLENLGVRGKSLDLFKSYLTDREQKVKVNGKYSEPRSITCGVPQGTVLGPILYLIYANDLFSQQSNGEIISFADDTAIFYQDINWLNLKEKVETDFPKILSFFNSKLLTINFEKTHYLTFSSYSTGQPPYKSLTIRFRNKPFTLNSSENMKYLGLYIDNHMRWNTHISFVVKKLRSIAYIFYQMCPILSYRDSKLLYQALVEPHLSYGMTMWGGAHQSHLRQLEIIQKRFFKTILKENLRYPSELVYENIGLYDLKQLYFAKVASFYYKHKEELQLLEHHYNTRARQNENCTVQFRRKNIGQKNFTFLGKKLYNQLPLEIRKAKTVTLFKTKLKKYLMSRRNEIMALFT